MMDRDKVIKGLEHCISDSEYIDDNPCKGCPYFVSDQYGCDRTQMEKDALALLKEQKGLMLALEQSNAVNGFLNAEVERLNGLLKEQEAEKPIAKEDDTYECCLCGAIVGRDELDASGIVQSRFNYCQNCGKDVNWE